jgi:hypothetical protein
MPSATTCSTSSPTRPPGTGCPRSHVRQQHDRFPRRQRVLGRRERPDQQRVIHEELEGAEDHRRRQLSCSSPGHHDHRQPLQHRAGSRSHESQLDRRPTVTGNTVLLTSGTTASADGSCTFKLRSHSYPGGSSPDTMSPAPARRARHHVDGDDRHDHEPFVRATLTPSRTQPPPARAHRGEDGRVRLRQSSRHRREHSDQHRAESDGVLRIADDHRRRPGLTNSTGSRAVTM